jgi:hypothetical protein
MGLELRPLPSTGVTQLPRYYEPLRHPGRPGLSLAGVRLRVTRPHRSGLPVFRWIPVSRHAIVVTPVARRVGSLVGQPLPAVSLLASGCGLPRLVAGSAPPSVVSRPARRSLALRPACSPRGQAARFSRRLRRLRYLHRRSDSYWLERPNCQAGISPAGDPRLFTAHNQV